LNKTFEVIDKFKPDIIETNYLWPFCSVAVFISQYINKPLLIRHAGSDILKFQKDKDFRNIICRYFGLADKIVTNSTCNKIVSNLCDKKDKIILLDRYIPDTEFFFEKKCRKKYDILFAGKINYYWNLKGIEQLINIIKINNLKALFIIDGNYVNDIHNIVQNENLSGNIATIKFVHPAKMPQFINQSKSIWYWEDEASLDDFSNLIWESFFCRVPCFINYFKLSNITIKGLVKLFPGLILPLKTPEIKNLNIPVLNNVNFEEQTKLNNKLQESYDKYIRQNISLYESMIK
jgi:hypothetical protein